MLNNGEWSYKIRVLATEYSVVTKNSVNKKKLSINIRTLVTMLTM